MAQCMYPYTVERQIYHKQEDRFIKVPCGKCPSCLKRRLASWSFRLEVEALLWQVQHFVTLTYNTEHVPLSTNGFMTLDKDALTLFFKRLRKRAGKLRYYAVGEYGTKGKRPHYHAIIYGNSSLEVNDIIQAWPFGQVYFGKVEAGSIRYCVQYYDKGDWYKQHERDDRVPEFSRMSQGIGLNFMTPKMVQWFLDNPERGFIYDREGRKIAVPRYFKKRLYDYMAPANVVAAHPSILIHRDDMVEAKDVHNEAMRVKLESLEQPEETPQLIEDRKAAILNYRSHKRKTRD